MFVRLGMLIIPLISTSNSANAGILGPEFCHEARCVNALDKAEDAFKEQSGINSNVEQLKNYGTNKVNKIIYKLGFEKELAIVAFGYKCYNTKSISFAVGKKVRVEIKPAYIATTINFHI